MNFFSLFSPVITGSGELVPQVPPRHPVGAVGAMIPGLASVQMCLQHSAVMDPARPGLSSNVYAAQCSDGSGSSTSSSSAICPSAEKKIFLMICGFMIL